jgi:hypothetical protein
MAVQEVSEVGKSLAGLRISERLLWLRAGRGRMNGRLGRCLSTQVRRQDVFQISQKPREAFCREVTSPAWCFRDPHGSGVGRN